MSARDVPEYVTPDLAAMSPRAQRIALEWWEMGYLAGHDAGYARAVADDEAAWARMRETIRQAAQAPSFAELCRRRGDHARAEATERLWRERGVA